MPTLEQVLEYILEPYNLCYTIGNLLCFLSFAVRDMLRLRLLYIAGGLFTLPYFMGDRSASPEWLDGRWLGVFWVTVYTLINVKGAISLVLERRPVFLSREEKNLHAKVFHMLTPREMLRLLKIAEWHEGKPAQTIIHANEPSNRLLLIYAGRAAVFTERKRVATLDPGQFIGEMSFVSGALPSADVRLETKCRYLSWDFDVLHELEKEKPELYQSLFSILSVDLAIKLGKKRPDTLRQTLSLTMVPGSNPRDELPTLSERPPPSSDDSSKADPDSSKPDSKPDSTRDDDAKSAPEDKATGAADRAPTT